MIREGWVEAELKYLLAYVIGGDWGKNTDCEDDKYETVYCIRGTEFKNWEAEKGQTASLRKVKLNSLKKRKLAVGDILLEISGGGPEQPVGRTILIDKSVFLKLNRHAIVCTNFLRLLRPLYFLNPKWINTYLSFFYITGKTIPYQGGSNNLRNLKYKLFQTIKIPLAPLPEQDRVMDKIEELFTNLDAGVESLKKVQAQVKWYRQAVLKHAFEGKLTAAWREAKEHQLKPISSAEDPIIGNGNKRDNKQESVTAEISAPRLPDGWKWLQVKKSGEIITGNTPSKKNDEYYTNKVYPFFKPGDLYAGYYVRLAVDGLSEKGILKAKLLPEKSILVTCIGATIGKTGLTRLPGASNQQINAIVPYKHVMPEYIYFACTSPLFQRAIKENASSTTLPILNKSKFGNLFFPLPSYLEQQKIVEEIERRFSIADRVEEIVDQNLKRAERLRQSILKKAFEGKFVAQDPTDEPASVLLERIWAEKEKSDNQKPAAKGAKTNVK